MIDIDEEALLDLQIEAKQNETMIKEEARQETIPAMQSQVSTSIYGAIQPRHIPRKPGTAPASWERQVTKEEQIANAYVDSLVEELTGGSK